VSQQKGRFHVGKSRLSLVAPTTVLGTVAKPRRKTNLPQRLDLTFGQVFFWGAIWSCFCKLPRAAQAALLSMPDAFRLVYLDVKGNQSIEQLRLTI
jgi:hypothetical protein